MLNSMMLFVCSCALLGLRRGLVVPVLKSMTGAKSRLRVFRWWHLVRRLSVTLRLAMFLRSRECS